MAKITSERPAEHSKRARLAPLPAMEWPRHARSNESGTAEVCAFVSWRQRRFLLFGGALMNCPQCGREMEQGRTFRGGSGRVIWSTHEKKVLLLEEKGDVTIMGLWEKPLTAWICKYCRLVTIRY